MTVYKTLRETGAMVFTPTPSPAERADAALLARLKQDHAALERLAEASRLSTERQALKYRERK